MRTRRSRERSPRNDRFKLVQNMPTVKIKMRRRVFEKTTQNVRELHGTQMKGTKELKTTKAIAGTTNDLGTERHIRAQDYARGQNTDAGRQSATRHISEEESQGARGLTLKRVRDYGARRADRANNKNKSTHLHEKGPPITLIVQPKLGGKPQVNAKMVFMTSSPLHHDLNEYCRT